MKHRIALGACVAIALAFSFAIADEALKSGPQVGAAIGVPFNPLNVSNVEFPDRVGKKNCFV